MFSLTELSFLGNSMTFFNDSVKHVMKSNEIWELFWFAFFINEVTYLTPLTYQ